MSGKTYGYVRVSSRDQSLDRQLDALKSQGIPDELIYADKSSGKDFDRPEYQRLRREAQRPAGIRRDADRDQIPRQE